MRPKPKRRLTVQMDELWSFVDHKGMQQWVWLAMDADTRERVAGGIIPPAISREIGGCHIGDRSTASAQVWQSMPSMDRQCAVIYSDFWSAYGVVLPTAATLAHLDRLPP